MMNKSKAEEHKIEHDDKKYYPRFRVTSDTSSSLTGYVQIPILIEKENTVLDKISYDFYIDNTKKFIIIQTKQPKPRKLLQGVMGKNVSINEIDTDKENMKSVSESILSHCNCIIHNPRFDFAGTNGYNGHAVEAFTMAQRTCVTKDPQYQDMMKQASQFKPIFRIFDAEGIAEEQTERGRFLKVNPDLSFSMYVDVDVKGWVKFVRDVIYPVLKTIY